MFPGKPQAHESYKDSRRGRNIVLIGNPMFNLYKTLLTTFLLAARAVVGSYSETVYSLLTGKRKGFVLTG